MNHGQYASTYVSYICCDYEFVVHINTSNNNYKSIRINGYSDNPTAYTGSQFNLAYKFSGMCRSSSSVNNFCNSLNTMTFSDLTIPNYAVINNVCVELGTCIYSNFDLKTSNGDIYNPATRDFYINLSTTDNTNNPVIAYSNYFDYNDATKYKCYISTDAQNWTLMNYETFNNTETGNIQFRFNYKIVQNGTYYFKLLDTETNEEKYITYVVTNILKNSSNSGFNKYGIPQPFCTYERVNDEFIIKTQNFTLEEMQKYECLYIKDSDFSKDYFTWNKMSIGTYNNLQLNQTEYYFFFTVPANSEDCIFYFVFYDNKQQKYGDPSSMNCNFAAMNEYSDSLNPIEKEKKSKFYELLDFFKDRFGFLTYPFEFIGNLLNRFFTIDFKEPIFYIPDIKEPFTNSKIISAREFNLNSILDNNIFKTIHDYYLLFVDAFVFVGIINLLRLKFKEVSTK